ncbi:hypothetical protein FQN55_004129 [Onygenales sp. PD_40]|nr:hypothetical protein FQN55_004129 [Onygenales sp. PD_40]
MTVLGTPSPTRSIGVDSQAQSLPEVVQPGLEVDWRTPNLQEKYSVPDQALLPDGKKSPFVANKSLGGGWSRTRWIVTALLAVIVILVAVLVPVGLLVIGKKGPNDPPINNPKESSPSASPPASADAVLKGTRLSSMDPRTGTDIFLFYQYGDGSIQYMPLTSSRAWQGSKTLPVENAMIGTPLTTTYTSVNGKVTWWVFYVDKDQVIQNIYSPADPSDWKPGNVGSKKYTVPAESSIAFTIARGRLYDAEELDIGGGLTLFASGTDGQVREYIYNDDDDSWSDGFTFAGTNGSGGACMWSQDTRGYLFMLGESQTLDFWYRNYTVTTSGQEGERGGEEEVENSWQLGPSSGAAVMADTSMCGAHTSFAFQGADGMIQGSNFTTVTDMELMRWDTTYNISEVPAFEGSALSCWFLFPPEHGEERVMFEVFYQAKSGEIIQAKRYWGADNNTVPGTWEYVKVPIR